MENGKPYQAKLRSTRVHIADVVIQGQTERLSWIRTGKLSVNILISERVIDTKLGAPRVIGEFRPDEGEEEIKALCRDYVRRQSNPVLTPIPLPLMSPKALEPDEEIEFGEGPEPLFGSPR